MKRIPCHLKRHATTHKPCILLQPYPGLLCLVYLERTKLPVGILECLGIVGNEISAVAGAWESVSLSPFKANKQTYIRSRPKRDTPDCRTSRCWQLYFGS